MSFQANAFQANSFQTGVVISVNPGVITGVYNYFGPDIAFILEDAFERAGISPQAIDQEKMYSCMRSIRLMLNSEWLNYGVRQWMVKQDTEIITAGDNAFDMPVGSASMLTMVSRRNGADVPVYPMSRAEYTELAVKGTPGRPSRFFVDKEYNNRRVYLWPVADRDETILYDYLSALAEPGSPSNILELDPAVVECFTAGLAMRLALKFNKEFYKMLMEDYGGPQYPSVIRGKLFQMKVTTGEDTDMQLNFRPRRR